MSNLLPFYLYERSVQSPRIHVEWFDRMYREIRQKTALSLREDFCGTFAFSYEWANSNPKRTALGLDLDKDPIRYGKETRLAKAPAQLRRRVKTLLKDVRTVTTPKVDLAIACNFSFCIFKERKQLTEYFRSVCKSLNDDGILILEAAGGPGMIEPLKERKTLRKNGKPELTYIWHQKSFDPIHRNGKYAIHFKLPNGKVIEDAFTYDWRLWTIPELREALDEAGFSRSVIYWETEQKGVGTGEYHQTETGDNAFAWVAYIIGVK